MKKTVFNVGDRVRIINAEVFQRCGYPFNMEYAREKLVTADDIVAINNLLGPHCSGKAYDKVHDGVAYNRLVAANFGGKTRSIHVRPDPNLRNKFAKVASKRVIRTGEYVAGGATNYSNGEYDYTPAYLEQAKSHVILGLLMENGLFLASGRDFDFEIEAKNVTKV